MSHAVKLPVCPNCATDLGQGENYCPTCGQPNHDVNVTFGHVIEETLEGIFHFDSKVWLTFRELVLQPGKLTVDFLAGRRARFVPPIRLYVFLSLVFFFLLNRQPPESFNFSVGDSLSVKENGVATASPTDTTTRRELQGIQANEGGLTVHYGTQKLYLSALTLGNRPLLVRLAAGQAGPTDSLLRQQGITPTWLNRLALKRIARTNIATDEEKAHVLVRNLSIGMFVLMPLFALLLKLFYRRQRPLYVQHLIFSVHLHCFFFLLFSVIMLLSYFVPVAGGIGLVMLLGTWLYWVMALRRFSGQSWGHTLWKSALLFAGYVGLLVLFVVGLVAAVLILL